MLYILISDEGNEILTNEQITTALEYINIKDIYNANKKFYSLGNEYYLYPGTLLSSIVQNKIIDLEKCYHNFWLVIHDTTIFNTIRVMIRHNLIEDVTLVCINKDNIVTMEKIDKYGRFNYWPKSLDIDMDLLSELF